MRAHVRVLAGLLAAVVLAAGVVLPAAADGITDEIRLSLSNRDPNLRVAAAKILGESGKPEAIQLLLQAWREENETEVRQAIRAAIVRLTHKDLGDDYRAWADWWKTEEAKPLRDRVEGPRRAEGVDRLTLPTIIGSLLALVALGLFVGYRMKQIKELLRRGEACIASADQMLAKSDTIRAELEARKAEVAEFISSVKTDNESEIERFSDHIERNVEHRMREVTMTLRQKAEKELEQTLSELKQESLEALTRLGKEQREKLFHEFEEREKKFLTEVEAHTLFLEASYWFIQGKHEEALKLYRRLVLVKPNHYVAWNNLGTILRKLGRFDEAIEAYDKGLALAQDNAGLLYNKAAAFAQLKKTPEMLELLERSVRLDGEYKDDALNDDAFKEYWNVQAFKDIAEG